MDIVSWQANMGMNY